jgi:hypothetical protein
VEKGRGNHTRRFDVPLELEKLTFDAHPTELLPEQNLNYVRPSRAPPRGLKEDDFESFCYVAQMPRR